jgi:hypothetical protein
VCGWRKALKKKSHGNGTRVVQVYMPEALAQWLEKRAEQDRRSISQVAALIIEKESGLKVMMP